VYNGGGVGIGDFKMMDCRICILQAMMFLINLYINEGGFKFKDITATAGVDGGKVGIMVSQLLTLIMTVGRISMFVKVDMEKQKLKEQTCFTLISMILLLKSRQKNMGLMKKDTHCMLLFLIWIMTMILMSTSLIARFIFLGIIKNGFW
jgi:hypothetical protein